jgi:transcriptional regulator with GAF, ATPase, and Fis domain
MNDVEGKINSNSSSAGLLPDRWRSGGKVEIAAQTQPIMDLSLRSFRNEAEINAISSALAQTGWNRKRAAKLLSISYRGLLYKIRRHNITATVGQEPR